MADTDATTNSSTGGSSGGLMGALGGLARLADPQLLMSLGLGLASGARYGSNAGEGLLQGLQTYQGLKTSQLQRQLMGQQVQAGNIANQRQQMMLGAAQQALQGDQSAGPGTAPSLLGGLSGAMEASQTPFLPGISPMPAAGGVPPSAPSPSQGLPAGLAPPSMSQIYNTTYPGGGSPGFNRAMAMFSQDPAAGLAKAREDQIKLAQQSYAPTIARLDQLIKADQPAKYMNGTGFQDLKAAWPQLAQTLGMDPDKDYNDQNVRLALSHVRNQLASSLQEPTSEPAMPLRTIKLLDGRMAQVEPGTGKVTPIASEDLQSVLGPNGQPTLVPRNQAAGMTPFNQVTYGAVGMQDPKVAALDAALTTSGVNLPGGRNGQQRVIALQNLIRANPDANPQDIANQVRTGQLDFNGARRSTGQLATLSSAANVQSLKIEKDLGSLGEIIPRLPGGPAKLANIMTNLQKDWSWNGDKDSTEAVGYVKELSGEYAKLVSGSTGMAAPAEGEMKSALGLMQSALTQNGYAGMHDFLLQTSQNRRDAVKEGLQTASAPGASVGGASGIKLDKGQSHSVGGFTVTRVN